MAVKSKLGIPSGDKSLDVAVQAVLDAADEHVEDYTGFSADALTGRVDIFETVKPDQKLYLTRRPVSSITTATTRDRGSAVETNLTYDLVNAADGYLWLVPETSLLLPNAHQGGFATRWDIVTITYDVTAASPTADLIDAIAELAAFWYKRDRANVKQAGAGPFSTVFETDRSIPPHVKQRMYRYRRRLARIVGGA